MKKGPIRAIAISEGEAFEGKSEFLSILFL